MMTYYDFLMGLEDIAIRNRLSIDMHRAEVGCGFFFHFYDRETGKLSKQVVYLLRESADELFERLEIMARDFRNELAAEKRERNIERSEKL